jgi:hypothetical protein
MLDKKRKKVFKNSCRLLLQRVAMAMRGRFGDRMDSYLTKIFDIN